MKRWICITASLLLTASLLAGCVNQSDPSSPTDAETEIAETRPLPSQSNISTEPEIVFTEPESIPETQMLTAPPTQPDDPVSAGFSPYLIQIPMYIPIYGGPSFSYGIISGIQESGTYTIVDEAKQYVHGRYTTFGKLKSGAGWVNLEYINLSSKNNMCTECGIMNVSICRYGYCDDCFFKNHYGEYGFCAICDIDLTGAEANSYDGTRCFSCAKCDQCEGYLENEDFEFSGKQYLCKDCYKQLTGLTSYCTQCSKPCKPSDNISICPDCEGSPCFYCGGPLYEDHNCDDYPNVICPVCGWGIHITGVGSEGISCPDCGTKII